MLKPTLAITLAFAACSTVSGSSESSFPKGRWIDLTHEFGPETLYWPTADGFRHTTDSYGMTDKGYFYVSYSFQTSEHGGTHLDAPIHFAAEGHTSERIPLEQLMGPAVVIDVSAQAAADQDYQVTVEDLEAWEASHTSLPTGSIVLLNTGFHEHWPDPVAYMGTDERGPEAVGKLRFPGLHPDAAAWLVAEREIHAIGIDTPSIDHGQSSLYGSHRALSEAQIPAFENVANVGALPATGAWVIALPMKIKYGSGAPLRIVAYLPEG